MKVIPRIVSVANMGVIKFLCYSQKRKRRYDFDLKGHATKLAKHFIGNM